MPDSTPVTRNKVCMKPGRFNPVMPRSSQHPTRTAIRKVAKPGPSTRIQAAQPEGAPTPASLQPEPVRNVRNSVQSGAAQDDADLASDLIASGVTTQPVETVIAVLAARRSGATVNAAAKAAGINYRTAQRIVEAAEGRRQTDLVAAS
jgi:hypothetical protein